MAGTNTPDSVTAKPGATCHPLGPIVYRLDSRRPGKARLIAAVVLGGCTALLWVAAWMTPAGEGMGSHQQLGFPPCSMLTLVGYPCPTCGMTTAFAFAMRGELRSAFNAQPAGLALALITVIAASLSLSIVVTSKVWAVNWYRVSPTRVTLAAVLLVLAGWGYKVVAGLISGTLPLRR